MNVYIRKKLINAYKLLKKRLNSEMEFMWRKHELQCGFGGKKVTNI